MDSSDGYHPDMESCKIYKLVEVVEKIIVAKKEDFTEEEWNEKYNKDFDECWELCFK